MKRSNYAKIGVFVVLAAVLAIAACLVAGARSSHPSAFLCETYVDGPVSGVDVGASVRYRGIPVGTVRAVEFAWLRYAREAPDSPEGQRAARWARIVFAIDPKGGADLATVEGKFREEVAGGLRVALKTQGITGTSYLDLDYPAALDDLPAPPWVPENFYVPSVPSLLQTLTGVMQGLSKEVAKVGSLADSLDSLVGTATLAIEEGRLPVADIADNLRRATASLDEFLERVREDPSSLLRPNPAARGSDPP